MLHISDIKCYVEHHKGRLLTIMSSQENPNLHLYWSQPLDTTIGSVPSSTILGSVPSSHTIHGFTAHPGNFGVIHELEVFDEGIVVYHAPLDTAGNR